MEATTLNQPLLSTGDNSIPREQTTRGLKRVYRSNDSLTYGTHGTVFSTGFAFFVFGNTAYTYVTIADPFAVGNLEDPKGVVYMLWAVLQTVGLLMMTTADLGANRFLRRRIVGLILLLFIWAACYAILSVRYPTHQYYLEVLPFAYLMFRFQQIINMHHGFIRLTELLSIILGLDLFAYGISWILPFTLNHQSPPYFSAIFIGLIGPCMMFYAHRWSAKRCESPTLRFQTTIFTYLFIIGFGTLLVCIELRFGYKHPIYPTSGTWIVGPVHLVPTLAMFFCRTKAHRKLGRGWIRERQRAVEVEHKNIYDSGDSELANLAVVEGAIIASVEGRGGDLNDCCFRNDGSQDAFTILQVACWTRKLDAVQRLLLSDVVDINKGSEQQGWTALYIAAKIGEADCAMLLLEYDANVDKPAMDGQTPLLVASAEGHSEVIELLLEFGADR
jgi:hypothetical protein